MRATARQWASVTSQGWWCRAQRPSTGWCDCSLRAWCCTSRQRQRLIPSTTLHHRRLSSDQTMTSKVIPYIVCTSPKWSAADPTIKLNWTIWLKTQFSEEMIHTTDLWSEWTTFCGSHENATLRVEFRNTKPNNEMIMNIRENEKWV